MPLRKAMVEALETGQCDALRDPVPVLEDTLASLALLDADGDVLAAAILHAAPDLHAAVQATLTKTFPAVANLLEGQRAAGQVWALHAEHGSEPGQPSGNSEGLRRLLLAIVRDLRAVPILLARQLARLRHAGGLPAEKRRALAQLTRDIHAPLANRLGIWQLKWELEDLAFRYLDPDTYKRIARLLDDKRVDRERYIEQVKTTMGEALAGQGLRFDIAGRPKHIYSIFKKMQRKDVPFGELYDLRAVRVLVDDVPACYAALGVVHALWVPIASEFDDYIARPKHNDYRSLHTAVVGPGGQTLEVQIRTFDMHAQAELGVAAHWRYKEGGAGRSAAGDAALDRKIEWMRRLLDAQAEGGHADDGQADGGRRHGNAKDGGEGGAEERRRLFGELDSELVEDRIYTLTPRGEVIDLPVGATPLDFAYRVHTEVGHRCRGAKVDGRIVTLDHKLQSGNRVEIMTARTGEPRRDWLVAANGFLASARSRDKVRHWFHQLDRGRNVQDGRDLLDRELKRAGVHNVDPAPALEKFHAATLEDLQVMVALGDVGPHQVTRILLEHERARDLPATSAAPTKAAPAKRPPPRKRDTRASAFTVVGVDNLVVQVARCCQPLPGEPVSGYLTRSRGVSVHRADCATFLRLSTTQPQRVLPVEWGQHKAGHEVDLSIDAVDRKWLLKELTNLVAQEEVHILDIGTDAGTSGGRVRLRLSVRVQDFGQLSRLMGKIDSLAGIERVRRS